MAEIHSYFVAKARAAFTRASGDPDLSGPLAEWAQNARQIENPPHGVIVAEDGEIMAETRHTPGTASTCGGTYVTDEGSRRWELFGNEVGIAKGQIARKSGKNVIHVKYGEVCQGAGRHV